jgi:sugar phosphate isomerase/epimerase
MGSTASAIQPSLGFSLYGMKMLPLDVAMKACAEIGYSHIEFALNAGYPTEPAVFSAESRMQASAMLKELRLSLPCMMLHLSLTADDKAHASALALIQSASELGRDLVPEQPPILETVLGGSPTKWEEQKKAMVERLHDWASTAEKSKTVIAIKAHVSSAVNSPERLLWLLDEVKSPSIQIAYDYSHFELQGIDMEESMKLLLPRTRFIHVKDSVGELGKFQFVLPGAGRTDYIKYFGLLRQHSYAGTVCVEVSGQVFNKPNYDPIAAAKESYLVLSKAMNKVR